MAEVISYQKEFLPHIIRLFAPGSPRVDAHLGFFQQLFALYQPAPEQSCLLLKGADRLLACAYLVSLSPAQPNLIYVILAVDAELPQQDWEGFWQECWRIAESLAPGPPILQTAVGGAIPGCMRATGFQVVRRQVELHASLGQLTPVPAEEQGLNIISLAREPAREGQWLEVFNHGLTVFWDMPQLDSAAMQRLRTAPGFDGEAFRLGLDGEEPVSALFYTVLDTDRGVVRINAAATPFTKRSKGFGRKMLRDTLGHLESIGLREAVIFADAANQATNLLFKMLGFAPAGIVRILEQRQAGSGGESPASEDDPAADTFAPGFISAARNE